MAEIFRPVYHVDPVTGKRVNAGFPGAVRKKSKTWHIRYYTPDGKRHKVMGYPDKKATENKAAELERRGIRLDAGVIEPSDVHAKTPLAEHLADYVRYLAAKGNTAKHVALTQTRAQACLDNCGFVRIADVQPSAVLSFLDDLRRPTVAEGEDVSTKGKSIATANYYLTAVKGFTRWLWKDRRIGSDPLAGLSKLANGQTDIRHARRELSPEEFAFLLDTVAMSKRAFRYLSGADRHALYMAAAGTGLRASELASLTPASFDLDVTRPVVRLQALTTKNRKEAEQPMTAEVADVLRGYLNGRPAEAPVWPGTWSNAASAKMIRLDLKEARKKWLQSFQDARQRTQAEQSDFLTYRDAAGFVADFHSLRHLYVSRVVRSGASPKVAQELVRHCDVRLTLGRYAHVALHDLSAAMDALPDLLPPAAERSALATGTDGHADKGLPAQSGKNTLGPNLGPRPAKTADFGGQTRTANATAEDDGNRRKTKVSVRFAGKEKEEAPPGFEPGMADLQSAALPLGEGADAGTRHSIQSARSGHDFSFTNFAALQHVKNR
jgi:integrase